ncbi:hypothetical protein TZ03_08265 [Pseudomonas sp. 10-1B]|nr:hypothetical protein TZ03_08265 [Pseudomonas sp. 10-1B]
MSVGGAQRVALPELITVRVDRYSLHDQMAQCPKQLDVGIAFKALWVVLLGSGGGFLQFA